jgi:hypothetical protein
MPGAEGPGKRAIARPFETFSLNCMRAVIRVAIILGGVGTGASSQQPQSPEKKPLDSWAQSCDQKKLFLRVSVAKPRLDGVPETEINVRDPRSRQQGVHTTNAPIPESRYEIVAAMAKMPKISTEHAVEICGAEQGKYLLTVYEHGNENYRLTVEASNEENHVALPERLHSEEGKIREFSFRFRVTHRNVNLTWLDANGRPQLCIVDNDW